MSSGGFSERRLGRLHEIMTRHVERGTLPGLVTLVSRRGETRVDAFGTMAVGGGAPMRRDTIFRISSMTKPVTAVAALILIEECRLRLDDPVDRLLPELADRRVLKRLDGPLDDTVPANRPITVRDLLTLRMGLGCAEALSDACPIQQAMAEHGLAIGPRPSDAPGVDAWMSRLGALPLMYQPGERWLYETGFDVLGVLIARAAEQPLESFFHERIFEPLGMRDTGFVVPAEQRHRLPVCYQADPATGALAVFDDAAASRWLRPPPFPSGGGALVSTVDDYLTFGQMLLNHGKHGATRILSRPSVELMTTDQLLPEQRGVAGLLLGNNRGWGFGVAIVTRRDEIAGVPGRYGWDGGYGTSWASDPREQMVGILMTQLLFPQSFEVYADFWTLAYQAIDD
jgi:CubicO group peptidase (beta-lactamase class C family)